MKTETLSGTIKTAFGVALPEAKWLKYSGTVDIYETPDEVRAANDWPSNDETVAMVNQSRKAARRAKLMSEKLAEAGYQAPTLEDKSVQFATMVKVFVAAGRDEVTARQLAEQALGHTGN